MSAKTLIATGVSSGLGLEVIRQLLVESSSSWRMILGVRDPSKTRPELDGFKYDNTKHDVSVLKCDFNSLHQVQSFAKDALGSLGDQKLDYLMLNHAVVRNTQVAAWKGSKYSENYIVNHQSHHYLMHLLRHKVEQSHTRVVFVSSGAIRMVKDTSTLAGIVKADSDADRSQGYAATKFIHLLGAHHWRRQLGDNATVVAVSPGMIPGTNLGRHVDPKERINHQSPDAKDVPTGARSILAAFDRNDIPQDEDAIFLTSWGEWWDPKEIYPLTLDKNLQDEWCVSQEEIEKDLGPA